MIPHSFPALCFVYHPVPKGSLAVSFSGVHSYFFSPAAAHWDSQKAVMNCRVKLIHYSQPHMPANMLHFVKHVTKTEFRELDRDASYLKNSLEHLKNEKCSQENNNKKNPFSPHGDLLVHSAFFSPVEGFLSTSVKLRLFLCF